jgi:predicted HTH transcriptional regulator
MARKKKAKAKPPKAEESLSQISKYAKLVAGSVVIELAKKIASREDRKIIWVFCEGKLTREQIATKTKIPKRTVSYFIDECMNFGLLEEESGKGGHPKRVIDYVPEEWKRIAREKVKLPQQSEVGGENVQQEEQ